MSQKAPKEQIPALLAELVNRQANLKTVELIQTFLSTVHVAGRESAANMNRCFSWLEGVTQGEAGRCDTIKALLPDQDTEVTFEPSHSSGQPQDAENVVPPPVTQGQVELEKGEPVLG